MWPGGPTWTDPVDPNALTLSMLPLDVLRCVLVQRGVGPRELCALEQTSRLFRSLVDEETWKHAFLEHRRCNVLREPESWKLELTRRTMWSRNWRQIVGCSSASHLRLGLPKLRRFAQKVITGGGCMPGVAETTMICVVYLQQWYQHRCFAKHTSARREHTPRYPHEAHTASPSPSLSRVSCAA